MVPGGLVEHGVGVRSSRVLEFKRLDEDFFSEE
jgi:restriction system protein